jgi:membrane-associated phospholipid phosphatase
MQRFDDRTDRSVEPLRRYRFVTRAMVWAANAGVYSWIWIVVGAFALALGSRRRYFAFFLVAIPVEFALTNGVIKRLFGRKRPISPLDNEWTAGLRRPRTSSFPSGHASAAGFSVAAMTALTPIWPGALLLAAGICFSRVFLRLHHGSDVVAGFLWGASCGLVFRIAFAQ